MNEAFERKRRDQRASDNADQAEFDAVIRSSAPVDAGTFDERIAGAVDDYDPDAAEGEIEEWNRADLINDDLVGDVQAEVERRVKMLGTAYPFALDGNSLSYNSSRTGYYEFCLSVTRARTITRHPYTRLPRQFERTSADLVREYMGWESHVLHVGWPRDRATGTRFRTAMDLLHRLSGEWFWMPAQDLPLDPHPREVKDEGVDFIVWKNSLDQRLGHLFLLAQCACGDDWGDKLEELNPNRFLKWFNPGSRTPFVRAFATPFVLSDGNMRDALDRAGLVFDRVRLTLIAESHAETAAVSAMPALLAPLSGMVLKPV